MEAVGYDLYCKMLNQAVMEAKGEKIQEDFETSVDIDIDAFIPSAYIKNEFQKLDMYKRIASIQNADEYGEMLDELIDRFGELPKPAANLLLVALIRAEAHQPVLFNWCIRKKKPGSICMSVQTWTLRLFRIFWLSTAEESSLRQQQRIRISL